jgi:hypothetical protein
MLKLGKTFWRTTRAVLENTAVKLIVAALAALGFADIRIG